MVRNSFGVWQHFSNSNNTVKNVTACTPNTNTECMRVKVMRDVTHNGIRAILKSTLDSHILAIPLLNVVVSYDFMICSIMICVFNAYK